MKNRFWLVRSFLLLLGSLVLTGCAPLSPMIPFHLAETSRVLPAGETGLTLSGGFGQVRGMGDGFGGGVRIRFGLGGGQEFGAEATYLSTTNGDTPSVTMPWLGNGNLFSEKISWKIGLSPWLSALAGAGGTHSATGTALGGDLGLIASPEKPVGEVLPYVGLRGSLALPADRPADEAGGATRGLFLAVGGMWELEPRFQVFVEGGGMKAWNHGFSSTSADTNRVVQDNVHEGGYLAFGGVLYFGGEPAPILPKK